MWRPAMYPWDAHPRYDVLELFAAGLSAEQILEELPDLQPEDIQACLNFAVWKLDHPVVTP